MQPEACEARARDGDGVAAEEAAVDRITDSMRMRIVWSTVPRSTACLARPRLNTVTSTGNVPAVPVDVGTVQTMNVLFAALISHSAPPMVTKLVVASGENWSP